MNSSEASSKVASMDGSKLLESYGMSAGKKIKKKYVSKWQQRKTKENAKEIILGEGSGITPESLGSSSDAAIGFVTASSAGTSGIIKSSSSAKRKKITNQRKNLS